VTENRENNNWKVSNTISAEIIVVTFLVKERKIFLKQTIKFTLTREQQNVYFYFQRVVKK